VCMKLSDAIEGNEYIISRVAVEDEEINSFLLSLGCYSGESVTVVSRKKSGLVVIIKDGRYNIDNYLSDAIEV